MNPAEMEPALSGNDAPEAGRLIRLQITGMHCASCVAGVERALQSVAGVSQARVSLITREAFVRPEGEGTETMAEALCEAVRDAGYEAELVGLGEREESPEAGEAALDPGQGTWLRVMSWLGADTVRLRAILAALAAFPVVVVGMAHVRGTFPDLLSLVLTTLVMALGLRPVLWPGIHGLLRRPDMNSLVALGTMTAYGVSVMALVASWVGGEASMPGVGHSHPAGAVSAVAKAGLLGLYFEAAALTMAAVLLGRWLEARCLARAAAALKDLDDRIPTTALRLTATGEEETVRIGDIQPGDRLLIRPGDLIPADGKVFLGQGEVDESLLTGESLPILKRRGDEVAGGTLNGTGHFQLRVTAAPARSAAARLAEAVRQAQMGRPRLQRLADAVAAWFVPGVLVLAVLTALVWLLAGAGWAGALPYGVAVLVVACPCALGLATPAAIMAATGRAAQEGILFRDADALERLARCQTVVLDKTGTVTEGRPQVVQVWSVTQECPEEQWLGWAAAAESPSEHVWARAVVAAARERRIALSRPDDGEFLAVAGYGVRARVEGDIIWVGEPTWVAEQATIDLPPSPAEEHQTVVAVARPGGLLGWIALEDRERTDAALTMEHLRRLVSRVVLLTGDREGPARAVAQRLGVSYLAGARNKELAVRGWQAEGQKVAMVGDGLNDAAALAQADCGLAMHSGTGLAHHAAHVLILGQRLEPLPKALSLARRTVSIIHQNLGWALGYNLVGIPLAAGAFQPLWGVSLHPAYAGLFMALSSVAVTLNSLRLMRRT